MDTQVQELKRPFYKKIYTDILDKKFPERKADCKTSLDKENLSALDIIKLNQKIFGLSDKKTAHFNQKHRSYSNEDVLEILDYQRKNKLNNIQLANHFKISRNTITKWKKILNK